MYIVKELTVITSCSLQKCCVTIVTNQHSHYCLKPQQKADENTQCFKRPLPSLFSGQRSSIRCSIGSHIHPKRGSIKEMDNGTR